MRGTGLSVEHDSAYGPQRLDFAVLHNSAYCPAQLGLLSTTTEGAPSQGALGPWNLDALLRYRRTTFEMLVSPGMSTNRV
jgi:hypothetical protein